MVEWQARGNGVFCISCLRDVLFFERDFWIQMGTRGSLFGFSDELEFKLGTHRHAWYNCRWIFCLHWILAVEKFD